MVGTFNRSGGDRVSQTGCDRSRTDGPPIAPDDMPDDVAGKWRRLMDELPLEVLRRIDGHELGLLAQTLALADRLAKQMVDDPSDHKAARLFLNALDRVHRLSASFGLNPGDRKRLDLVQPHDESEDPMEAVLRRFQGGAG